MRQKVRGVRKKDFDVLGGGISRPREKYPRVAYGNGRCDLRMSVKFFDLEKVFQHSDGVFHE